MQHILSLEPLLKLYSQSTAATFSNVPLIIQTLKLKFLVGFRLVAGKVQESYCYQIFLEQNNSLLLPTVQQLVEHSFYNAGLKLAEVSFDSPTLSVQITGVKVFQS